MRVRAGLGRAMKLRQPGAVRPVAHGSKAGQGAVKSSDAEFMQ